MEQVTFGQIVGWAFGVLHLSRNDFYMMSPAEFWQALEAHTAEKLADRRHTGELARGLGVRLFNLWVARRGRVTKVEEFWRMPWDESPANRNSAELQRLNSLEGEALQIEIDNFLKKMNHGEEA